MQPQEEEEVSSQRQEGLYLLQHSPSEAEAAEAAIDSPERGQWDEGGEKIEAASQAGVGGPVVEEGWGGVVVGGGE